MGEDAGGMFRERKLHGQGLDKLLLENGRRGLGLGLGGG